MKFVAKKLEKTADASSGGESWRERLKNVALVIAGISLLYVVLGFIADFAVARISDETEATLFQTDLIGESDSSSPEFDDAKKVFARLTAQPGLRDLPYELRYMSDREPNAFAAPGGSVIVTQGLLDAVTNTTALAFVLGHELGHHQHRHTLRGLGRAVVIKVTFAAIFGGADGGIISKVVDLAESRNSRKAEREADDFGFRLAHSVYGNADGYMDFFEHLHERYRSEHLDWLRFASSHPPTAERLEQLRELQRELAEKREHLPVSPDRRSITAAE